MFVIGVAHSATRLVSYMDDDQDDDADLSDSNASAEDSSPPIIFGKPVINSVRLFSMKFAAFSVMFYLRYISQRQAV